MRPRDLLATAGAWSTFALTLCAFDPVLRVARAFGEEPMDRAVSTMCRVLAGSIRAGLGRLEVEGLDRVPRNGRLLIVSNHQSLVESFLPLWFLDHLRPRYIAKRDMGRFIPAVSYNLRRAGHCLIDRGDREQALEAIEGLGRRVAAGEVSALIFPEGTRSATGQLNEFKFAGLATLLRAAPHADVLPMVVHGGNLVFPRGRPRVRAGSTVRIRLLPVLRRREEDVDPVIERVREVLTGTFEDLEARYGAGAGRGTAAFEVP